jgi:hypothetical protein
LGRGCGDKYLSRCRAVQPTLRQSPHGHECLAIRLSNQKVRVTFFGLDGSMENIQIDYRRAECDAELSTRLFCLIAKDVGFV